MNKYYIEIAYCDADRGYVCGIKIPPEKTVLAILQMCQIEAADCAVGINGQAVSLDTVVTEDCRIELYPPLQIDPIEKRKRLVAVRRKNNQSLK